MSIANTEQAEHWNTGPGVAHWVANQARYDRMHAPFTALILDAAALRPGGNVLDVGCGCGGTTLAAARLVAPGRALGLDLSGPMLARAQADAEAAGLGNAAFRQGDAQVEPLESASFDTVISRFGVMFFADPARSFANLRNALRKGGRLTFVCWQEPKNNPWLIEPMKAVYRHVPRLPQLGPEDPGPFSFASPERVNRILVEAGFAGVNMEPHGLLLDISAGGGIEAAVRSAAEIGPANLALEGQPEEVRAAAVASIRLQLLC